jgi:glycine/D-amino acid oxidase-like deaminating enzyme
MPFTTEPSARAIEAVASAKHAVYWLDRDDRPSARPELTGIHNADLTVIGGGFTGLWSAIEAKLEHPDWQVVLIEGGRLGSGGSGRNGGFLSPSLTHGLANGMARWPDDMTTLLALGHANVSEIRQRIAEFSIDCDFRKSGELTVAVEPHQVEELRALRDAADALGEPLEFLDQARVQAQVHSPTYLAALRDPNVHLMDPGMLAWGLARTAESLGVVIHEHSPVLRLSDRGSAVFVTARSGGVLSARVALGTNAYPPLLRRIRQYVVPVYDYVLMSEPLTPEQWESTGWSNREGIADAGNQFHYYRPTIDGRILWGGYDAVYHRGNGFGPKFEHDAAAYQRLAQHFQETFPQLGDVRFTHAWGGAIDTCSRFTTFWGTAHGGKTSYAVGFTGLGTGSSRFAALTMLDLLTQRSTVRTQLPMVRTKPLPFPGEPLRSIGIAGTTRSLQAADRNGGHRNIWLRTLDRFGLGFDS